MSKRFYLGALVALCLFFSGCALLKLPFQIMGGVWEILKKMPMPPPGVF